MSTYILTIACPDRMGLVHAVTGLLLDVQANILNSSQYEDAETDRFFLRLNFSAPDGFDEAAFRSKFEAIGTKFEMDWHLYDCSTKPRVLLMVSKFDHCLLDLLYRRRLGELDIDIPLIVSNHQDARGIAEANDIPFVHLPVNKDNKPQQEAELLRLVEEHDIELVVLARYMQVLSDKACDALRYRVINIHHSFLPSFKGAKPYHQAHARGVKLIGATAHFATSDLDEGPIIEQDVARVDHRASADQYVALGRDIERLVLARAVKRFTERRILINGTKTIVFA